MTLWSRPRRRACHMAFRASLQQDPRQHFGGAALAACGLLGTLTDEIF